MKLRIINHDGLAQHTKVYQIDENEKIELKNITHIEILPITSGTDCIIAKLTFIDVELDLVAEKTTG